MRPNQAARSHGPPPVGQPGLGPLQLGIGQAGPQARGMIAELVRSVNRRAAQGILVVNVRGAHRGKGAGIVPRPRRLPRVDQRVHGRHGFDPVS